MLNYNMEKNIFLQTQLLLAVEFNFRKQRNIKKGTRKAPLPRKFCENLCLTWFGLVVCIGV